MYIPQGWTKFYEFTSADLRTASQIITRICDNPATDGSISWIDVHGAGHIRLRLRPLNVRRPAEVRHLRRPH